ncbi:MAG: diguanylate cyclase [Phycisphaeraceae bacterium]|nr:MAG: diguanylate cyclase [Phycisphaeraceae bacterium]
MILVGRTGLEGKLRLDEGLEVVRVRTPMDAVGELASLAEASPGGTVVVIADQDAGHGPGRGEDSASALVEGLRLVDAGVRVLRVSSGSRERGPFDGVVHAGMSVDELRSAIRGRPTPATHEGHTASTPAPAKSVQTQPAHTHQPQSPPTETHAPHTHETPQAAGVNDGAPGEMAGDGDAVLAVLRGHDLAGACLSILRRRTGDDTLRFESGAVSGGGPGRAPVAWEGHGYGTLVSGRAGHTDLSGSAAWLAGWFRLGEQHAQLRDAAFTDPLTGAWNRRYFDRFMSAAIDEARAARRSVTVLVFDIDNFKSYNDRYGHDAGDDVLRETVRLLRSAVRPTDRVCRIGGDEFAVIFHEPAGPREATSKHPASIHATAERFQKLLAQHRFPKLTQEAPGCLTISGGLATYPWDGQSASDLIARADALALEGKRSGKNVIALGPPACHPTGL